MTEHVVTWPDSNVSPMCVLFNECHGAVQWKESKDGDIAEEGRGPETRQKLYRLFTCTAPSFVFVVDSSKDTCLT